MTTVQRAYPRYCLSLFCGEVECPANCQHLPDRLAFLEWQRRTNAVRDPYVPIWTGIEPD